MIISFLVGFLARRLHWPNTMSISLAAFLFLIPVLQPMIPGARARSWPSRILLGLVVALAGAGLHTFLLHD
ncbi:MAG TPA: hypothetical protein VJ852_10905 [Gemmatimonadaceae bacterium]|nr:hypothetical protein [Gemmatimonadaceae bacterium]